MLEDEEPDMCFSPERRFDAKDRRERPPRRYDKHNEQGQVKLLRGGNDRD